MKLRQKLFSLGADLFQESSRSSPLGCIWRSELEDKVKLRLPVSRIHSLSHVL
ncbi:hypothetical protein ACRRTK_017095 [Alexandromys fortis]